MPGFEIKYRSNMPRFPNRTGRTNLVSGVYHSVCHNAERTILEDQKFPRCGYCNVDTSWIFVRPAKAAGKPSPSPESARSGS
jgi:hypothetical protein